MRLRSGGPCSASPAGPRRSPGSGCRGGRLGRGRRGAAAAAVRTAAGERADWTSPSPLAGAVRRRTQRARTAAGVGPASLVAAGRCSGCGAVPHGGRLACDTLDGGRLACDVVGGGRRRQGAAPLPSFWRSAGRLPQPPACNLYFGRHESVKAEPEFPGIRQSHVAAGCRTSDSADSSTAPANFTAAGAGPAGHRPPLLRRPRHGADRESQKTGAA